MKIYTRRGDDGETGLFGGARVRKSDDRVEAYGTVDELNAAVGLALAVDEGADHMGGHLDADRLKRVQDDLFAVGARLAAADPEAALEKGHIPEFPASRIEDLERWIDRLDEELSALDAFLLPGGSPTAAQLHVARTVCRRAERRIVRLAAERPGVRDVILPYVNRLSDLLFTLARAVNHRAGVAETEWEPVRRSGRTPGDRDGATEDGTAGNPDGGSAGSAGDSS